jgi:predicted phosphodiesterase
VAIVTDTHFGVRNDNIVFGRYINKFFRDVFFKYIDEHKIKYVIHCGDIVDRRKTINFITARNLHQSFVKPCLDRGLKVTCLIGNHDVYFKDTNEVNALTELYSDTPKGFRIISEPTTFEIEGTAIDAYPWINKTNESDSLALMAQPRAKIALGHFEMMGLAAGVQSDHDMDPSLLENYQIIGSGHIHSKSSHGRLHFFGCPYPITWADYEEQRGFHVLDLDELTFKFIENPLTIFKKVNYDDRLPDHELFTAAEDSGVDGCIVKLVVEHKQHPAKFDEFYDILEAQGPLSITIQQDAKTVDHDGVELTGTEDTLTMIRGYAEAHDIPNERHKKMLVDLFTELYHTAATTQEAA